MEEELARAVGRETSLEKSSSVLRDELVLVRKQASSLQEKVDQAAAMDEVSSMFAGGSIMVRYSLLERYSISCSGVSFRNVAWGV